ncbi:15363_t:CDS:2 [Cetraspora pellucida]|uniref:15363_t:CDS:1 n=1 Tax=Cetraspora pellucida TaxID=1433469 RepID=A0A9N9NDF6_9GLOM|nr:15363_t:CDS:2 [Cetraspora pellucida]
MLQTLLKWKEENPLWVVAPHIETVSRKLNSLLWLSPAQRSLYEQFHDVVIMDTTANTNQFQMMLFIVAIIDNNFRTRIVASCIIEDETLDTFKWIYETLLEKTSVIPMVIFTNSNPTMINAINQVDNILKKFLTPIMLGKQRDQMNASVCYDVIQVYNWHSLIEKDVDNKEIRLWIREQDYDTRQILFTSLIELISEEMITQVWHVHPNITPNDLFLQMPAISISVPVQQEPMPSKTIYVELFGVSKKVVDVAIKANAYKELSEVLKNFLCETQSKVNDQQQDIDSINVINPFITKHKGCPPKRFKSAVKSKEKYPLKNSTQLNIVNKNPNEDKKSLNFNKGQKCSKCGQADHYAKTCTKNE